MSKLGFAMMMLRTRHIANIALNIDGLKSEEFRFSALSSPVVFETVVDIGYVCIHHILWPCNIIAALAK